MPLISVNGIEYNTEDLTDESLFGLRQSKKIQFKRRDLQLEIIHLKKIIRDLSVFLKNEIER